MFKENKDRLRPGNAFQINSSPDSSDVYVVTNEGIANQFCTHKRDQSGNSVIFLKSSRVPDKVWFFEKEDIRKHRQHPRFHTTLASWNSVKPAIRPNQRKK